MLLVSVFFFMLFCTSYVQFCNRFCRCFGVWSAETWRLVWQLFVFVWLIFFLYTVECDHCSEIANRFCELAGIFSCVFCVCWCFAFTKLLLCLAWMIDVCVSAVLLLWCCCLLFCLDSFSCLSCVLSCVFFLSFLCLFCVFWFWLVNSSFWRILWQGESDCVVTSFVVLSAFPVAH